METPVQIAAYRYQNLALAANSYRLVGTLLKSAGVLIVLGGPVLLLVGMNTEAVTGKCPKSFCSPSELVGGLNQTEWGFTWPLAVVLVAVWLGFPIVIRGITQSAQGEALLALADIAVATTSIGNPESIAAWSSRRSVSSFAGSLAAAVCGIVLLILTGSGVAVHIAESRKHLSSLDTLDLSGPGGPSAPTDFSPGRVVEFVVGSDKADWSAIDEPHLAFSSGESATVDKVTGLTFTTTAFPGLPAPVSAARLVEGAAPTCSARLSALTWQGSTPTCQFNSDVGRPDRTDPLHSGTLTYPCAGGAAVAHFGSEVFSGQATKDRVDLLYSATYEAIGCTWRVVQRVQGSLSSGTLQNSYTEAAISACKNADRGCTGSGTLSLDFAPFGSKRRDVGSVNRAGRA